MGLIRYSDLTFVSTINIELPFTRWEPNYRPAARTTKAIDGTKQVVVDHVAVSYRAECSPVPTSDTSAIEEWIADVSGGEAFEINPTGTIASPGTLLTVTLDGGIRFSRINKLPQFRLSFTVERVL